MSCTISNHTEDVVQKQEFVAPDFVFIDGEEITYEHVVECYKIYQSSKNSRNNNAKNYYKRNAEKVKQKAKERYKKKREIEPYLCGCGSMVKFKHGHLTTKKHRLFLEKNQGV